MRDRQLRQWKARVRERARAEWRDLSTEVVDELACHLADVHASARENGASDAEADRVASEALGSASFVELSKRPRARRSPVGYVHDVRVAFRQLVATPVVTLVAVLSLALGIGANTAIFSLVEYALAARLAGQRPRAACAALVYQGAGLVDVSALAASSGGSRSFSTSAFAWCDQRFNLASGGVAEFVDGAWATAGMFETLGVPALLGRTFTEADDVPGGGPDGAVAVISYGFWQRRFGGAVGAIGRRLTLERTPFTIVGVMPPDFFGPDVGRRIDVAVPVGMVTVVRPERSLAQRDWWWLSIIARLKPGQSVEQATEAFRGVQPQIRSATLPDWAPADVEQYLKDGIAFVPAASGSSALRARYERPLLTLMVVVALVLLIACANIANLLLARATARRHEWSVRLALGASRWRLVRLLLTESLLLSITGAAIGFLIARWGSDLLVRQLSTATSTVFLDLSIDWRVLTFTTAIAVMTALLFGTAPAFRAAGVAPMDAIKEQGRGAFTGRMSMSNVLVVAQVALSVVLVVGAALFVRTFEKLARLDLGFDPDPVLVVRMNAERAPIEPSRRIAIFQQAREAVQSLPGVRSAALSYTTPVSGAMWGNRLEVSEGVALTSAQRSTFRNQISPQFFETYSQRLVAGRAFTDRDGAPPVAIVNEAFARRFLNGANPIGHTVRRMPNPEREPAMEIVGVVADAVYRRLRDPMPPTLYTPVGATNNDVPTTEFILNVRAASGSPALLTRSVADAILGVNRDLALTFRPLSDQIGAAMTQERLVAMLSGFFGALALLLAGLGLYGVTSYAVTRRRAEIGIRMALGAPPASVVRLVLTRVALLVGIGVLVGAGVTLWASTFVATLLYGLEPHDPATIVGSAVVLAAVGALAGWLPAQRASRIDPAEVLRDA